jgi:Uma2 family endonuclease
VASPTVPSVYRLTYADWLRFPDDGLRYEIIEGELFVTPPPSIEHQRASRNLALALASFLKRDARGEVLYAPVGVRLGNEDIVEPDLIVVLKGHESRIGASAIEGAPDLVVEILSPGSARRDLGVKREKYRAAGVAEYWIVDPANTSVEVLALEQGQYVRHGLYRRDNTLRSRLLDGLEIALNDVFPAI